MSLNSKLVQGAGNGRKVGTAPRCPVVVLPEFPSRMFLKPLHEVSSPSRSCIVTNQFVAVSHPSLKLVAIIRCELPLGMLSLQLFHSNICFWSQAGLSSFQLSQAQPNLVF